MNSHRRIARIAYNSAGWQWPTGDACNYEVDGTYASKNGFAHEEWLFRGWLIDGWRYSFLQGVWYSHRQLVKKGEPFDVILFTLEPDKNGQTKRRYVATIRDVECLTLQQAEDALNQFKLRGWYDAMQKEIENIGKNPSALVAAKAATDVLNIRFRLPNLAHFSPNMFAPEHDPVQKWDRYILYRELNVGRPAQNPAIPKRSGSPAPPMGKSYQRRAVAAVECTPEHARMQAKLMQELHVEYPNARVVREQDFIDVSVRTEAELIFFEIKSDLEPRTVIRQALGQILEYAYHPIRQQPPLPVRLVIVGQNPLTPADQNYIDRLKSDFGLPIVYRKTTL